jgi:hypothetical protein
MVFLAEHGERRPGAEFEVNIQSALFYTEGHEFELFNANPHPGPLPRGETLPALWQNAV